MCKAFSCMKDFETKKTQFPSPARFFVEKKTLGF